MSAGGDNAFVGTLGLTVAVSLALHAGGLAAASHLAPHAAAKPAPVEVEFEAVPPAPPPPPPVAQPEPPPPPRPEPKRVAVAKLPKPPPKEERPPLPPPPNEEPPKNAPPAPKAPPIVGLSANSTAASGAFAVQSGNTTYGKASDVAVSPREVKPYASEDTAPPPPRISRQPRLLERTEPPYPEAARRAEVEGLVMLLLHIDAQGRVVSARVVSDPGAGLGEAARVHALKLRFSPALLDGEPVEVPDFPLKIVFHLRE